MTRLTHIAFSDAAGASVDVDGGESAIRRSVFQILESNDLCSMATMTAPGRPHINTAHFCYSSELVFYFLSHPSAQHCRNLRKSPLVAVAVFSSAQRWGRPGRGVQLFGRCRPASRQQVADAERRYARRFPAYRRWRAGAGGDAAARDYRFYRIRITSLKLMDEREIGDGVFASADVRQARPKPSRRRGAIPRRLPVP